MRIVARLLLAAILLCVPVALAWLALPRLEIGIKIAPTAEVMEGVVTSEPLPRERFVAAAAAFANLPDDDGDGMAQKAEFEALAAGENKGQLLKAREDAIASLMLQPTNPRTWTVLCEIEAATSTGYASASRVVTCLDKVFMVAPLDWFTAPSRMKLVVVEWPFLDSRLRNEAVALVLPMWHTDNMSNARTLRVVLKDMNQTQDGRAILRAGLASEPGQLHAFYHWMIEEALNGR